MKYSQDKQMVSAVYDNNGSKNPLIEALPEPVPMAEFQERISSFPPVPIESADLNFSARVQNMAKLQTVFIPLDYMYFVYDTLYRMMQSTYYTRTSKENVTRINALFTEGANMSAYGTQPQTGALLGTAGVGKTTTMILEHLNPNCTQDAEINGELQQLLDLPNTAMEKPNMTRTIFPVYYNAWLYDDHKDPLVSFLYFLSVTFRKKYSNHQQKQHQTATKESLGL